METLEAHFVKPEDRENMLYWAKKWGISYRELYEAILDTGCLETEKLKAYVHRDKWIYHPITETAKLVKAGFNLIF